MQLSEESTTELIKALLFKDTNKQESAFEKGEKLLIRTVTHYLTGRVVKQVGAFLTLEDAAWIADTGRFSDALKDCSFSEVEPHDKPVRVNTEAIIDVWQLSGNLPREQS